MLDQTASGNMVVHRRMTKSSSITGQPPHTSTVEGTGNLEFDSLGRSSCILIVVKSHMMRIGTRLDLQLVEKDHLWRFGKSIMSTRLIETAQ